MKWAKFDQMVWPALGEELDELEHRMRYGPRHKDDCTTAASVIAAYRALILKTTRNRNYIVSHLKESPHA